MSIGRGWHPDEVVDEEKVLATGMLKSLLDDVFKMIADNKEYAEYRVPKGKLI